MSYATPIELAAIGLPAQALAGVATATQQRHLDDATARIDSYLRTRYSVPLTAPYPAEVIECCAKLAAYTLLVWRGFDPVRSPETFRLGYEDAITWLKDLSAGRASLAVTADATPNVLEGAPRVQTGGSEYVHAAGTVGETRGW